MSEAPTGIPEEEPSSSVPAVSDTHSLRHQFHDHARNLRRSPRLLISHQCGTYSRYIFTGTFSGFQSSARARLCTLSLDKSAGLVMEQRRNEPAAAASSAEHNGRSAHRRPAGSNEPCGRETRRVAAPERQRVAVDGRGETQTAGSRINVEYCRRTSNQNPYPAEESWLWSSSESRRWIAAKSQLRTIPPIARTTYTPTSTAVCLVLRSSGCRRAPSNSLPTPFGVAVLSR